MEFVDNNKRDLSIDGLKGFSVLIIVLYHFSIFDNNDYFFPGFIGVDIFFVISGYLIAKSIKKNKFDYFKYFENRLRRVALPLILVVAASSIFTIFFFNKNEIIQYNYTSIFSLLFIANYKFWIEAKDYFFLFNTDPLMHLWSLGIEIQFYIILPIILIYFKKIKFLLIPSIIFVSLVLPHTFGSYKPNFPFIDFENLTIGFENVNFQSYFLFFTRVWELLIGSFIFLLTNRFKKEGKKINFDTSFLAFFLLIISFIIIKKNTPIPGLYLLLPVSAVCFFLLSSQKINIYNKVFKNNFLVYFGNISYSLYLIHYPIYTYSKLFFFTNYNATIKIIFIFTSILLSHFSYTYIEKKSYGDNKLNFKKFLNIFIFTSIFSFFLCIFFINYAEKLDITKTIKLKYPEIYKNFNKTDVDIIEFSSFITNKKKILIIGNSHAADLYSTLKLLENRVNNLEFGYYRFQNILQIENFSKKNIYRNADIIIYAKRYDMSTEDELIQLEKLIEKIDRKKKFILINNSPHFYTSNLTIVEYSLLRNNLKKTQAKKDIIDSINETSYYLLSEKINNINNKLKIFAEKNNLIFYDSFDLFCELQKKLCYVIDEDFNQLYRDYGHLTKKGTIFFSKKIEETKWLIKSLF